MTCIQCGATNPEGSRFCGDCGVALGTAMANQSPSNPPPDRAEHRHPRVQRSEPTVKKEKKIMPEDLKESGAVTALSVVGLVFGLIGMLGSFIPCIGALAFYIGIPAAIASGLALGIAYTQDAKRTFAIVALTISLIGVVISGWQYYSIASAGRSAIRGLEQMQKR